MAVPLNPRLRNRVVENHGVVLARWSDGLHMTRRGRGDRERAKRRDDNGDAGHGTAAAAQSNLPPVPSTEGWLATSALFSAWPRAVSADSSSLLASALARALSTC